MDPDYLEFLRRKGIYPDAPEMVSEADPVSYDVETPDGGTLTVERDAPPRKPLQAAAPPAPAPAATPAAVEDVRGGRRTSPGFIQSGRHFNDASNVLLAAAGLPQRQYTNAAVEERDKMRQWVLQRANATNRDEMTRLGAERTKAYLDATQAARERDLARQAALAEKEGRLADAEKARQELEREKLKSQQERDKAKLELDARKLTLEEDKFKKKGAPKPPAKPGSNLKGATDLRKEYNALPEVKDFKGVTSAYEKIKRSAQDPSAAGDLSLIFAYMKVLDPGSTVREGEFANAQAAAGADQRLLSALEKVRSGQRLTPEQRQDFVTQAQKLYESQRAGYSRAREQYRKLAERSNAAPDDVTGPDYESAGGDNANGTATPSQPPAGDTITIRRKSDGKTKTLARDAAARYLSSGEFEEVR